MFSQFLIFPIGSQNAELDNRENQNYDEQDHGHGSRQTKVVRKTEGVLINAEEHRLCLVLGSAAREKLKDDENLKGGNDRQHRCKQNGPAEKRDNDQPEFLPGIGTIHAAASRSVWGIP